MDLQIEAILLAFKESPVFGKVGAFLVNEDKGLYTVDEIIDKFQSLKPTRQSDATYRSEIVQFLQRLEKYGAGTFTAGRRGKESRFSFYPGVTSILRPRIPEESKSDRGAYPAWPGEPRKADSAPVHQMSNEIASHSFVLRRGYTAKFELPTDLTEQEAERLAQFIKTLPLK